MPVKVAIVEDQKMIREYVVWICDTEIGYEVVGEVGQGSEVDELIRRTQPDLLLLDIKLPDEDGLEVATRARAIYPALRTILMSGHCDEVTIRRIEQAQVQGFIDKNFSQRTEFKEALQTVMAGRKFFSKSYQVAVMNRKLDPRSFDKLLTDREQEVAGFIACAMTDHEIAEKLQIAPSTVETHRRNIMRKLDIESTPKLIKYAIDHGFVNFLMKVRSPRQAIDHVAAISCLLPLIDNLSPFWG